MPTTTTTVTTANASGSTITVTSTEATPDTAAAAPAPATPPGFTTKPLLHYWNAAGRAECMRVLMSAAEVEWDEHHLDTREEYLKLKPELPYWQVPMIEVDGIELVQQLPILRYLAKQTGFWPATLAEEHLVDHVMEACTGIREESGGILYIPFPAVWGGGMLRESKHVLEKWNSPAMGSSGALVRAFPAWEKILTEGVKGIPSSRSPGPFLLGDKPTIADICIFELMDYWWFMNEVLMVENGLQGEACFEIFQPFPKIMALYAAVLKIGKVEEWTREGRKRYDEFDTVVRTKLGNSLFDNAEALY
jgi:glutathione S-transferase